MLISSEHGLAVNPVAQKIEVVCLIAVGGSMKNVCRLMNQWLIFPLPYTMRTGRFVNRTNPFVRFLCTIVGNVGEIFGHCRLLAIVRVKLPYFFGRDHVPKRPVPLRKIWRLQMVISVVGCKRSSASECSLFKRI